MFSTAIHEHVEHASNMQYAVKNIVTNNRAQLQTQCSFKYRISTILNFFELHFLCGAQYCHDNDEHVVFGLFFEGLYKTPDFYFSIMQWYL